MSNPLDGRPGVEIRQGETLPDKFIQIAGTGGPGGALYALDIAGQVWARGNGKWYLLSKERVD